MNVRVGAIATAAILLSSLSACKSGRVAEGQMALAQVSGDLTLPVMSVTGRKFATVIRQQYDFSCGSAALATLLTYQFSQNLTEPQVFIGMWNNGDQVQIRKQGFSLLDMKRYLSERGYTAEGYRISLDRLRAAALPGIALIEVKGYRHFVVVKGVDSTGVLLGDPAMGLRLMPTAEFQKSWNGIYFVVNTGGKRASFNAANDWSLLARARYMDAVEPLSVQALAVMRPGYGEF